MRNGDYISVQQASPLSGIYDSYKASLPELVNYIREPIGKETVLMVHQTWAYATNANHTGFKNYDQNQMKMYTSIVDAVNKPPTWWVSINYPFGNRHTKCTYLLYRRPYE